MSLIFFLSIIYSFHGIFLEWGTNYFSLARNSALGSQNQLLIEAVISNGLCPRSTRTVASGISGIKVYHSIWHPHHLLQTAYSLTETKLGNFSFSCLWQTRLWGFPVPQATLRWHLNLTGGLLCPRGSHSLCGACAEPL